MAQLKLTALTEAAENIVDPQSLQRSDPRSDVAELALRALVQVPGNSHMGCLIWNISDQGLRLWTPNKINTGTRLSITITKPFVLTVTADVRWCRVFPENDGFHVGVRVLNHLSRLESLHHHLVETVAEEVEAAAPNKSRN